MVKYVSLFEEHHTTINFVSSYPIQRNSYFFVFLISIPTAAKIICNISFSILFKKSLSRMLQVVLKIINRGKFALIHNVVFLGPPGVGKSHLAVALGIEGLLEDKVRTLTKYKLLIIDEMGYCLSIAMVPIAFSSLCLNAMRRLQLSLPRINLMVKV